MGLSPQPPCSSSLCPVPPHTGVTSPSQGILYHAAGPGRSLLRTGRCPRAARTRFRPAEQPRPGLSTPVSSHSLCSHEDVYKKLTDPDLETLTTL